MQLLLGWGARAQEAGALGVGRSHGGMWLACLRARGELGVTELLMGKCSVPSTELSIQLTS